MKLYIKPLNKTANSLYIKHGHFHKGDAGLDLYVIENQTFLPGETAKIKLGISCESKDINKEFEILRNELKKFKKELLHKKVILAISILHVLLKI